ncbi:GNAT family N-acetyltransferase [Streptomyces sp. NPDC086787]|uniref:GNAT family N-acetyltransferase n=1 Tax=Streptomyces sp. NPDC086787 TaxID=3365759 RepID=UPI003800C5C3
MPPIDASADAGTIPVHASPAGPGAGPPGPGMDSEDTLELRLPDELLSLLAEEVTGPKSRLGGTAPGSVPAGRRPAPAEMWPAPARDRIAVADRPSSTATNDDLLDHVAEWGPRATPAGLFHLLPVRLDRDLPLINAWMNDPAVAAFWELAGSPTRTEEHVRTQLTGDGRSVPCVGVLDGTPMSYWEIYRADLDPIARHCPIRPHDTGLHLLIGSVADRGRGLGSVLLRVVADLVLDRRPACARVIAEPDLRNTPSVAAFLNAGFRFGAEIDLPAKRAALLIRDRSLPCH